jgi:DNA polymerase-3 subunit beta
MNEIFHAVFDTKMLNKALNTFQGILEKKNAIANLSNIKISLKEKNAIFTGININLAATKECQVVNYSGDGEIIVNAHIFHDIVKKISHSEIVVTQNKGENILNIKSQNSLFKIPLQGKENFSSMDISNFDTECIIKTKDLVFLIENTLFAASTNDIRYFLCSIKITKKNDEIEVAATDGHRLAIAKIDYDESWDDSKDIEIILPRRTSQEILKQLKDEVCDKIKIAISPQKIAFFLDDGKTTIISKLISGNYPDYKKILENYYNCEIMMNNKLLSEAIDRCLIILDEKNNKSICLSIDQNQINLSAQSDNRGSVFETIEIGSIKYHSDNYDNCMIMINAYYLQEILRNIKAENNVICLNSKRCPILIKEENIENKFYFLMPMAS